MESGSNGFSVRHLDHVSYSRMLKKSASGVLASLRGSTYRSVRLASSLAAALLDSLFEHPEVFPALTPYGQLQPYCWHQPSFPQPVGSRQLSAVSLGLFAKS
jgi:hypothetical protein